MPNDRTLRQYEAAVLQWLAENGVTLRGSRVLAALSGGADSVALTLLLSSLAERTGFTLCAAHVHHGIRGEEADRDAAFCASFCEERGIPFRLLRGDAPKLARERHAGMEEAARTLRYQLLEEAADAFQADWIATAHTADDQLETVLLNLTRGAATRGFSGIPAVNGRILRPILPLERTDTKRIAALMNAAYVTDSTNASADYARNRIRRQVVPVLRTLNEGVCRNALENGRILRAEDAYLDDAAAEALKTVQTADGLSAERLLALPAVLRARAVRQWVNTSCEAAGMTMDRKKTAAVLKLAASASPSAVCELSGRWVCRRVYDTLVLTEASAEPQPFSVPLPLNGPLQISPHFWAEARFRPGAESENKSVYKLFNHCFVNCDTIRGAVRIRNRQPEDCFARNANSGAKPLKRVFTDLKIPRIRRMETPVVADDAGVLWVFGIGPNHQRPLFRPQDDGYEIRFREN